MQCNCIPCKTCGMKHVCNVNQPHPGGWYRVLYNGCCPSPKRRIRVYQRSRT